MLSRNPFAAKAAQALKGRAASPWDGPDAQGALALATIGAVDELRRANQIALATAMGDQDALGSLAKALGVGENTAPSRTRKAA